MSSVEQINKWWHFQAVFAMNFDRKILTDFLVMTHYLKKKPQQLHKCQHFCGFQLAGAASVYGNRAVNRQPSFRTRTRSASLYHIILLLVFCKSFGLFKLIQSICSLEISFFSKFPGRLEPYGSCSGIVFFTFWWMYLNLQYIMAKKILCVFVSIIEQNIVTSNKFRIGSSFCASPSLPGLATASVLCFKPAVNRQPGSCRWDS